MDNLRQYSAAEWPAISESRLTQSTRSYTLTTLPPANMPGTLVDIFASTFGPRVFGPTSTPAF